MKADAWSALAAWLTLAVVFATAVIALRQLFDARDLRREEARPWVVIDLDVDKSPHMIFIYFQNFGATVARNVRFTFTPQVQSSFCDDVATDFLSHTFPTLPPGKRVETLFDSAIGRFNSDLQMSYEVTSTYEDRTGCEYSDTYVLDINAFKNRHFVSEKGIDDLVKAAEKIGDVLSGVVTLDGIHVLTQTVEDAQRQRDELIEARRKLFKAGQSQSAPPPSTGSEDTPPEPG